ncbi:MAG: hypothetical protein EXS05_09380 [Planctomycetaceae bacterium]|nr:hypothetical protein [Planctomycetaceae bacterium]
MIDRFLIVASGDLRPDAHRILFCDGSGGRHYRAETDIELSHWRPNHTPAQFRAGTSTEICFRFLDTPVTGPWTLAVNNHLDVDGLLSVYALIHPRHALEHRKTIIQAAEMGDFWGWGEPPAQRLFQGLTRLMHQRSEENLPTQSIYDEVFERAAGFIDASDPDRVAVDESLEPLRQGVALVERGAIQRIERGHRLTQYLLPAEVVGLALDRVVYVPGFNEAISSAALLWPQVRARWDSQRVCLVSAEAPGGWHHDLWFPGYLWADTEHLWRVPGIHFNNDMQTYDLSLARLTAAVQGLQRMETATGTWALGDGTTPFHAQLQSCFPVVLRFVDRDVRPAVSRLTPETVAAELCDVFE